MPYCPKCGKELIITDGPSDEDHYFDFNTGKKMQKMYRWTKCPEWNDKIFSWGGLHYSDYEAIEPEEVK